jgi:hypothetical protein
MTVDGAFKVVGDVDAGARLQTADPGKRPQTSAQKPDFST